MFIFKVPPEAGFLEGYIRRENTDCPGNDIFPVALVGDADCRDLCDRTDNCVGFVLVEFEEFGKKKMLCFRKTICEEKDPLKNVHSYVPGEIVWVFFFFFSNCCIAFKVTVTVKNAQSYQL